VGCYWERLSLDPNRDLEGVSYVGSVSNFTIPNCVGFCQAAGYAYAGLYGDPPSSTLGILILTPPPSPRHVFVCLLLSLLVCILLSGWDRLPPACAAASMAQTALALAQLLVWAALPPFAVAMVF
jgi:hypothetical protein